MKEIEMRERERMQLPLERENGSMEKKVKDR
jgi:hypothetical protein